MINIKAKERIAILDSLNHPWFKNEKLDDKLVSKIINKQKIKKQKNIANATDIDPNIFKPRPKNYAIKEKKLEIKTSVRSTSSDPKGHSMISPRENCFPPIPEYKVCRFNTNSKGIIIFIMLFVYN